LIKEELGGVGPLGVNESERGKGYGPAIGSGSCQVINNIVIDWTNLVSFYKKLGFDIFKSYFRYNKKI